jgi:hypothetical protein
MPLQVPKRKNIMFFRQSIKTKNWSHASQLLPTFMLSIKPIAAYFVRRVFLGKV